MRALDEDAETPCTFEAAPGLSLVWSGAKTEVREKITESQGKQDAARRKRSTGASAKPGLPAQPSDGVVDDLKAFIESSNHHVAYGLIEARDLIKLMKLMNSIQRKANARLKAELARGNGKTI